MHFSILWIVKTQNKYIPNVIINHHNQLLSLEAKSVECCTIKVHFARDKPNPDNAPYLEAIVWQKHISSKNPIQLKIKATNTRKTTNKYKIITFNDLLTKKCYIKHKICTQQACVYIFIWFCFNRQDSLSWGSVVYRLIKHINHYKTI